MTWLLGRACTRGNALSPPSLMVVWLGYLYHHPDLHVAYVVRHEASSARSIVARSRSPGKIEVNTRGSSISCGVQALDMCDRSDGACVSMKGVMQPSLGPATRVWRCRAYLLAFSACRLRVV